jgi:hypothetical protein
MAVAIPPFGAERAHVASDEIEPADRRQLGS